MHIENPKDGDDDNDDDEAGHTARMKVMMIVSEKAEKVRK